MKSKARFAVLIGSAARLLCGAAAFAAEWPDLSQPAKAIGGGEADAAVIVGIENYFVVPGVPGAKSNAKEWYEYLAETRGVPPQNIKLLTNADATRERMLEAARKTAGKAGKEGTLWFVFVGHGAPSADGKDGLLVGVDAQQEAQSLQERSLRRGELLKALGASPAGAIRVVLDACFSGRGQDGATIAPGLQPLVSVSAAGPVDPRVVVLTAAKGNQFAGALPGANRPSFSYLVLGGLRGWAEGKGGQVTAGDLWRYATNALEATLRGRDQTPDLIGPESALVGVSAGEKGPNLAKLALATAGAGSTAKATTPPEAIQAAPRVREPEVPAPRAHPALDIAGQWNETDSRLVAEEIVSDLLARPWLSRATAEFGREPRAGVGAVENRSQEPINTDVFIEDLQRSLINSGLVEFTASRADFTAPGADFILSGEFNAIRDKEGGRSVIIYQTNLKLLKTSTKEILWSGAKKVKKFVKPAKAVW